MSGYVCVYRKILGHTLWKQMPAERLKVWFYILLKADYQEFPWWDNGREIMAPAGSLTISVPQIALECAISVKQARSALEYFEATRMICKKNGRHTSLISVCNWSTYQPHLESEGILRASLGRTKGGLRASLGHPKGTSIYKEEELRIKNQETNTSPKSSPLIDPEALEEGQKLDGDAYLASIGWESIEKASSEQIAKIESLREPLLFESSSLDSLYMIWARLIWFEEFWAEYWRKAVKKTARIAYFKAVKTLDLHDRVLRAVADQSLGMKARPEDKRPHASTWLNGERWTDTSDKPSTADLFSVEAQP